MYDEKAVDRIGESLGENFARDGSPKKPLRVPLLDVLPLLPIIKRGVEPTRLDQEWMKDPRQILRLQRQQALDSLGRNIDHMLKLIRG